MNLDMIFQIDELNHDYLHIYPSDDDIEPVLRQENGVFSEYHKSCRNQYSNEMYGSYKHDVSMVHDRQNKVSINLKGHLNQGQDLLYNQSKVMMVVSSEMLTNYNNYGRVIYYTQILNKNSQDLNISQLCTDCNTTIGVFYGFTYEVKPVIFAVYSIFGFKEQYSYTHLLIMAFMRAYLVDGSKKYDKVTFNVQSFIDIPRLECLAKQYKRQAQSKGLSVPSYSFLMDLSYIHPHQIFAKEEIPYKSILLQIFSKFLTAPSKTQFNLLKNKLNSFIIQPEIMQKCQSQIQIAAIISDLQKKSTSPRIVSASVLEKLDILCKNPQKTCQMCTELRNQFIEKMEQFIIPLNNIKSQNDLSLQSALAYFHFMQILLSQLKKGFTHGCKGGVSQIQIQNSESSEIASVTKYVIFQLSKSFQLITIKEELSSQSPLPE